MAYSVSPRRNVSAVHRRAHADREAVHVDPRPLRGEEVPQLVHEDQHAEDDEKRQDREQHGQLQERSWPGRARPDRRRARPRGRWPGPARAARRTASITSAMRPNGRPPARKAATATSFAALKAAGAVPPARPAATPSRNAGNTSGRTGSNVRLPRRHRVEAARAAVRQPVGMRERVEDRQLHRREAQLRDDAAVAELGEGVHDALRVHHDVERVVRQPEQEVRLDELERLVGQRRAVDGDLASPCSRSGGLSASVTVAGVHARRLPVAERTARRGEDEPREPAVAPGDALQHGAVLRVHRDQLAPALAGGARHELAGHHQRLLVGQRHALPRAQRGERGIEPGRADDRVEHDVHVGVRRGLDQHLAPGADAGRRLPLHEPGERRRPLPPPAPRAARGCGRP